MSVLKILTAGSPVLRQKAAAVHKIDKRISRLLNNMRDTLYAVDGAGLAAPQVGVSQRIVVIDIGDGNLFEMINPVITRRKGSVVCEEACLSVPQYQGDVERAEEIDCEFTNRQGKRMVLTCNGVLANVVQHELDHLDGILFIDRAIGLKPALPLV